MQQRALAFGAGYPLRNHRTIPGLAPAIPAATPDLPKPPRSSDPTIGLQAGTINQSTTMESNGVQKDEYKLFERARSRLAECSARDGLEELTSSNAEEERLAHEAGSVERVGSLILAAANRAGRLKDLSTVLVANARRRNDTFLVSALASQPRASRNNEK